MFAPLSVDADLIERYGAACAAHAADLESAAHRLRHAATVSASVFGPVGAPFLASLTRATDDEARTLTALGRTVAAGESAASWAARSYARADADSAAGILGIC